MNKQTNEIPKIYMLWGVILIVWALYRGFMQLPEWVDELIVKPLVFVVPVLIFVRFYEKREIGSVGLKSGKFIRDFYIGIGIGALFIFQAIIANAVKHGGISIAPAISVTMPVLLTYLGFSLSTAFCEELLVRGFLFSRLNEQYKNQIKGMVVSTLMYFSLLVPIVFTQLSLDTTTLLVFIMTNLILSFANTMIYSETKTLTIPILVHTFWNMAVLLYL